MRGILHYIRVAVFILATMMVLLALFIGFSEMMGQSMRLGLACMMFIGLMYQFVFWETGGKQK